jgi:hypothetical protein
MNPSEGTWDFGADACPDNETALAICKQNIDAHTAPSNGYFYVVYLPDGKRVAMVGHGPKAAHNAALIANAGNTFNATGKTPSQLAADLAAAQQEIARLRAALGKYEAVREEMFGHFCSNGMFNAWGKQFDCTGLNDAHQQAEKALKP